MERLKRLLLAVVVGAVCLFAGPGLGAARAVPALDEGLQGFAMAAAAPGDDSLETIRLQDRHLASVYCRTMGFEYIVSATNIVQCTTLKPNGDRIPDTFNSLLDETRHNGFLADTNLSLSNFQFSTYCRNELGGLTMGYANGVKSQPVCLKSGNFGDAGHAGNMLGVPDSLPYKMWVEAQSIASSSTAQATSLATAVTVAGNQLAAAQSTNVKLDGSKVSTDAVRTAVDQLKTASANVNAHYTKIAAEPCFTISETPWWTLHENSMPLKADDKCPPNQRSERENLEAQRALQRTLAGQAIAKAVEQVNKMEQVREQQELVRSITEAAKNQAASDQAAARVKADAATAKAEAAKQQAAADAASGRAKIDELKGVMQGMKDAAQVQAEALKAQMERLISGVNSMLPDPVDDDGQPQIPGGTLPGLTGFGEVTDVGLPPSLASWTDPIECIADEAALLDKPMTCAQGQLVSIPLGPLLDPIEFRLFSSCNPMVIQWFTRIKGIIALGIIVMLIRAALKVFGSVLGLYVYGGIEAEMEADGVK